jgi:hypothetical protein
MTMRTYDYYLCPHCRHRGYTLLSENDQPYSKNWERFEVFDLASRPRRPDEPGYSGGTQYTCPKCGTDMVDALPPPAPPPRA